jgi:Domain of unknown function (DUF4112)
VSSKTKRREAETIEWEVLPPEEKRRASLESLFRWVAVVMDELIGLPKTRFKFGLDPIIGLVPGIGDTASAFVSALVLLRAVRAGLPKILLARMSLNILINELVGIIPGIGDAFSFWFKSNKRNYELLLAHHAGRRRPTKSDWLFIIMVLAILVIIVGAGIIVSFLVLRFIAHAFGFTGA